MTLTPPKRLEVTFQKNVVCHLYILDSNNIKRVIGESHFSQNYTAFLRSLKNVEIFSIDMDVSVLDQRTITGRINKIKALGFDVKFVGHGKWIASK